MRAKKALGREIVNVQIPSTGVQNGCIWICAHTIDYNLIQHRDMKLVIKIKRGSVITHFTGHTVIKDTLCNKYLFIVIS